MADKSRLDHDSPAVQKHLGMLQGVVQRMAENSRSCKLWCVTLVSAVLVLVAQTDRSSYALIALIPAVLLLILDAYYLALERGFRTSYEGFVDKLHSGQLTSSDLYPLSPCGCAIRQFVASLGSFSIWPFYPTLVALILLMRWGVFG